MHYERTTKLTPNGLMISLNIRIVHNSRTHTECDNDISDSSEDVVRALGPFAVVHWSTPPIPNKCNNRQNASSRNDTHSCDIMIVITCF